MATWRAQYLEKLLLFAARDASWSEGPTTTLPQALWSSGMSATVRVDMPRRQQNAAMGVARPISDIMSVPPCRDEEPALQSRPVFSLSGCSHLLATDTSLELDLFAFKWRQNASRCSYSEASRHRTLKLATLFFGGSVLWMMSIRTVLGFFSCLGAPYAWRAQAHRYHKFTQETMGLHPNDRTSHCPVLLRLERTRLPIMGARDSVSAHSPAAPVGNSAQPLDSHTFPAPVHPRRPRHLRPPFYACPLMLAYTRIVPAPWHSSLHVALATHAAPTTI